MEQNRSTYFLPQERFDEIRQKYPKFNEPWSNEDVCQLLELASVHATRKAMSEALGRSPKSVRMKLLELGLLTKGPGGKVWTKADDKILKHYYSEWMPLDLIASLLDCRIEDIIARLIVLKMKLFESEEEFFKEQEEIHNKKV